MARAMGADDNELWRAVVVWKWTNSSDESTETTYYHGPYTSRGAAKSAITRERREESARSWLRKEIVSAVVQRGAIQWEEA